MDKETIRKIRCEQPLGVEETLRLDQALERQASLSALVAALPDDEPSLAWRSELNARLMAGARKSRRKAALRWFGGFAATAVAATALLMTLGPARTAKPQQVATQTPVEDLLIQAHEEIRGQEAFGLGFAESYDSL